MTPQPQTTLPPGFSIRHQGGSSFLEIDLSHFSTSGIRKIADDIARIQGYAHKPQREGWKGNYKFRRHRSRRRKDAAVAPATSA